MDSIIASPGFVDPATCSELIRGFESVDTDRSSNPFFRDMIVYGKTLKSEALRAALRSIEQRIRTAVSSAYTVDDPQPDGIMMCRWLTGKAMARHVDNQSTHAYSTPWRTHSAIVYLNDDYEGGELFFSRHHVELEPTRGLLVTFPAGPQFEHGVRKIRSGTRYTVACWFGSGVLSPVV